MSGPTILRDILTPEELGAQLFSGDTVLIEHPWMPTPHAALFAWLSPDEQHAYVMAAIGYATLSTAPLSHALAVLIESRDDFDPRWGTS